MRNECKIEIWIIVLYIYDLLQNKCFSADGISDRIEGEHPWWRPEGTAPQHGLQPERPLPPTLLCHTEGTGIKGESGLRSNTNHFFNWLVFILPLRIDFSAFAVSWTALWGGDGAVCWPMSETVEELQQQHKHHQSPRQCFPLPTYEAKLWDWQCKYDKWKAKYCPGDPENNHSHIEQSHRVTLNSQKERSFRQWEDFSWTSFLLFPSHDAVFRTLQESRCRWPCHFRHWWERLKILMRSFYVAPWRPSSPMQKKTWSWERPHFQTRCRVIVPLPAGRPSAAADSFLIDLCSITRFKTSCLICTWSCLTQSRWRSTKKTLKC